MTKPRGVASGRARTPLAGALSLAVLTVATLGCGGRSSDCDSLQTGCNPPPSLPTTSSNPAPATPPPVQLTQPDPAPSSSGEVVPITPTPVPILPPPRPPLPPPPGLPPDPAAEVLAAAALAAGCAPQSDGEPSAPDPAPPSCHLASPYYSESSAECTATWCGVPVRPIRTCTPVPMSFAGGYHYRLPGAGYDADFFFIPFGELSDPTPRKENFGWVHLWLLLGDTLEPPQSVVAEIDLLFDEAFAAGLDVVDGTIIGSLKLDPLAAGVQGPLYQSDCTFVTDEIGRVVPGDCACRFPTAALVIPLYVPLGPLFGEPPLEPVTPDAGAAP